MALSKVEICGVNTAKLPLLSNEEKEGLQAAMKMSMIFFRSVVSG